MEMLGRNGLDGVRVEPLAKVMGVTKGSFYWHFKDRDELLEAMLEHWRKENTVRILEFVGEPEDPAVRLQRLARVPFEAGQLDAYGLPVRLWARHDPRARRALAEVDDLRIRMKSQLFRSCGFDAEEANARALILYAYMRVAPDLAALEDRRLRSLCERLLLTDQPANATTKS